MLDGVACAHFMRCERNGTTECWQAMFLLGAILASEYRRYNGARWGELRLARKCSALIAALDIAALTQSSAQKWRVLQTPWFCVRVFASMLLMVIGRDNHEAGGFL